MIRFLETLGRTTHGILRYAAETFGLLCLSLYWIIVGPFRKKPIYFKQLAVQTVFGGVNSVIIVCFVNFAMGIVLAMQSAYQLEQLGATIYVAALVAVSMTREIGPVLSALVVAGRVGAAITAELSTMKVTEQIEALETLALNPVRYLVVPRALALLFMLPCLVMMADVAGVIGGYLIGVFSLDIRSGQYIDMTCQFLEKKDIVTGLVKAGVFSVIISMISCYQGLSTEGGAEGVGRSTTNSVVLSFIFIIIADAVLTAMFYFTGN